MPVENTTASRGYQLPDPVNQLANDVLRIIAAINSIDADLASTIASLSGKASSTHSHAISDIDGLQAALDSKIGSGSSIPISGVDGLQGALDAKAPINNATFTGTTSGVTPASGANNTQFATTAWVRVQGYLTAVATANINDGAVTEAKLANGAVSPGKMNNAAGLSVLGRTLNSTGARADIAAATNGGIFSRLGDALGFNTVSAIFDAVVGSVRGSLLWRSNTGWGVLAVGAAGTVLSSDGTDVSWQAPASAGFTTAGSGLAASGSTVSIDTNNSLGVGSYVIARPGSTVADGATIAGSSLTNTILETKTGGNVGYVNMSTLSGTWRNVSGHSVSSSLGFVGQFGLFIRIS
jgi:hypothetical protein